MDSHQVLFSLGTCPIYRSWSTLAGYFDGDGTVEFSIHPFTLKVRLAFDENWKPHLDGLKQFLEARGIRCGLVRRKDSYNTWHVVVSNIDGVTLTAKRMLPYSSKKRSELRLNLDYYGDRVTGDEFVETMNRLVFVGERTGTHRGRGPDFTYSRRVRESRRLGEGKRVIKRTLLLPVEMVKRIRADRQERSLILLEISKRYRHWIPVYQAGIRITVGDRSAR